MDTIFHNELQKVVSTHFFLLFPQTFEVVLCHHVSCTFFYFFNNHLSKQFSVERRQTKMKELIKQASKRREEHCLEDGTDTILAGADHMLKSLSNLLGTFQKQMGNMDQFDMKKF